MIPAFLLLIVALGGFAIRVISQNNIEKHINAFKEVVKELPIKAGYEVLDYNIELTHNHTNLQGVQKVTVCKSIGYDKWPKELEFYFNDGLSVSNPTVNGNKADISRRLNIIKLSAKDIKKDTVTIQFSFEGTPKDGLAYFDIDQEKRASLNRFDPLIASKNYLFVSDDYLLLTKESFLVSGCSRAKCFQNRPFFLQVPLRLKLKLILTI